MEDYKEPDDLPFNKGPMSNAHHEKSTFLSIPFKRNSFFKSSLADQIKEFFVKPTENDPIIDFKKVLMPIITASDRNIDMTDSLKQFFNHVELILPTENQWHQLRTLRIHAGAPETSKSGLDKISLYYSRLLNLEKLFPFSCQEVDLNFEWTEAFDSDKKVSTKCIHYEKASVLFNAACILSFEGANQRLWGNCGKQQAANCFQRSAGILLYIRDHLTKQFSITISPSSDLNDKSLTAFASLMLAQACECFYEKGIEEKLSSPVISKIAAQICDFYAACLRSLKSDLSYIDSRCPREWVQQVKCKWRLFDGIAHFHAENTADTESAVSHRASRLKIAKELVLQAYSHASQVGKELEDMVKAQSSGIIDAHSFTENANFEIFQQYRVDSKLLGPILRPSSALVNPIDAFETLKEPSQFSKMFHDLVSPKIRQDAIKLIQEYEMFVKDAPNAMYLFETEIEKLLSCQDQLKGKDFENLIIENRNSGEKLLNDLSLLQAEENIIKCDDILHSLEESLNSDDNPKDFKKIQKLRKELVELQKIYNEKCADFSALDWNKEKISDVLAPGIFDNNLDKFVYDTTAQHLKGQCQNIRDLINKIQLNMSTFLVIIQDKMINSNQDFEEIMDSGRRLLFDFKISLKTMFQDKNELFLYYKNFADIVKEQRKSAGIIQEFLTIVGVLTDIRRRSENILEEIAVEKTNSNPLQSADHANRVKSILNDLNYNAANTPVKNLNQNSTDAQKKVSDWVKKFSSPDLNEFRLDSFIFDGSLSRNSEYPYLKSMDSEKQKTDQSMNAPKLFSMASIGDLKRRLLKENGKLKDKFMSTTSLFSNKALDVPISSDDMINLNDATAEKMNIQEWVKTQQKHKSVSGVNYTQGKKSSMKDIFNEAVDPSGMIYMASVAAAAATSAGLASVQHRVSFRDSDQIDDTNRMKAASKAKYRSLRSRRNDLLKDDFISSLISDSNAQGKARLGQPSDDDDQLSSSATRVGNHLKVGEKSKTKNILSQIQHENKQMAHLLSSNNTI